MRTVIKQDETGAVRISYDDANSGERINRVFSCRPGGGYVCERGWAGNGSSRHVSRHVCERLESRGITLIAQNRAHLLKVIRREYRRMRASEAADRYLYDDCYF